MWALTCFVFNIAIPENPSPKQQELWDMKKNGIAGLMSTYFDEMGENGYAALNVLTDFATRPIGFFSVENRIDNMQRKAGKWIESFVKAIESKDFNFKDYLREYYSLVA